MSVSLVGNAEDGLRTIELTSGDNIIGRGEQSGVRDKKCSRKQVTVAVISPHEPVRVSVNGTNPSTLQRKDDTEQQSMPKGAAFTMNDGDTLYMIGKMYPFVLRMPGQPPSDPSTEPDNNDTESDSVLVAASVDTGDARRDESSSSKDDEDISHEHEADAEEEAMPESEARTYRLGLASLGTGALKFEPKRAAAIACEEIGRFLASNKGRGVSIVLAEPNREVFEEFQASRPVDERFVLTGFSLAALPGEGLPCGFVSCETNWRWKPADPEIERTLKAKGFFEKHRETHSNVGKVTGVYKTVVDETTFFVCVVPNGGNPLKPDYIEDHSQAEDALRNTYKNLFSKFGECITNTH